MTDCSLVENLIPPRAGVNPSFKPPRGFHGRAGKGEVYQHTIIENPFSPLASRFNFHNSSFHRCRWAAVQVNPSPVCERAHPQINRSRVFWIDLVLRAAGKAVNNPDALQCVVQG